MKVVMGRVRLGKCWIVEELLKAVIATKEMRLWCEVCLGIVRRPDSES